MTDELLTRQYTELPPAADQPTLPFQSQCTCLRRGGAPRGARASARRRRFGRGRARRAATSAREAERRNQTT